MNYFSLAKQANEIARDKGFWTRESSASSVATKVALIHTEIAEISEALGAAVSVQDLLEECADVVIRALDLAVGLDLDLRAYSQMNNPIDLETLSDAEMSDGLLTLHVIAARITQHDRKEEVFQRTEALVGLILGLRCLLRLFGCDDEDLAEAIEMKMAKNRERPMRHGRRY